MKKLSFLSLLLLFTTSCLVSYSQTGNVRFKANIRTSNNEIIPGAYIKIYQDGEYRAVDSLFCDDQGRIDRELPFNFWNTGTSRPYTFKTGYIIKKIYPTIIGQQSNNLNLEYKYPAKAELFFMDIQGRIYHNHSELSNGIYFYFLSFEDGNQSELYKLVITGKTIVSVKLINVLNGNGKKMDYHDAWADYEHFYVEIFNDGYISIYDSLLIDSVIVEETFHMEEAQVPSASYSYTGNMVVGSPIVFNASASAGANNEDLSYHWDFGDGKKGGTAEISHLYTVEGEYNVTLTVSGNFGAKHKMTKSLTIQQGATSVDNTGLLNAYFTDENMDELDAVMVSLVEGDITAYSNPGGRLSLNGLPVGIPLHLKITKEAYVSQVVELTIPQDTRESVFFTTLKHRNPFVTLYNAEFGGQLEGNDGTKLELPVRALVKTDGTPVSGNVDVNITPVDVAFESASFPGSFVGYDVTGEDGILLSYGVSEFHFEQDGEALNLADGKKATVLIPIYTSGAQPGNQIPLWSVNEDNGKWVQEGSGTVVESDNSPTGLALKAEVNHFSWFNCDDFEDDRKKKGLCWRWECTTAQCVKVKVGCWMSGAQRGGTGSKKNISEERDTIPPVFEVRDFIPEEGKILMMPYSRDVYIEARGFTNEGQLLAGKYTVLATDISDSFEIEVAPVTASDTVDLPLNTLYKDYLQPGKFLPFRIDIPEKGEYHIVFNRGDEIPLNGSFIVLDETGILLSGYTNQTDNYVTAYPGELIISISGMTQSAEGNFVLGISDPGAWLPGDTINIETGILYQEYLEPGSFKHFNLIVPEKRLFRILAEGGPNPVLNGRFRVRSNENTLYTGALQNKPFYGILDSGRMNISVTGKILTNGGNFKITVDEVEAIPIALNDSIYDSLTIANPYRLYKLESDHNTVLRSRFSKIDGKSGYRYVKIYSSSGKLLQTEYLYESENLLVTSLLKDSTYIVEISGPDDIRFALVTEEDLLYEMEYGDTILNRLKYSKDKDLYNFNGQEGDLVSIKGTQPDSELYKGLFALIRSDGKLIGRRDIRRISYSYDYEIVYKLPSDGLYSILVESTEDDTGSYQIILDTAYCYSLNVNTLKELDVFAESENYFELEIDEEKICHISVTSDVGGGRMVLYFEDSERLNELNNYRFYNRFYNASYTNVIRKGKCYLKLSNDSDAKVYINFSEPTPLDLSEKGEISFPDTIHQPRKVNTYFFKGSANDGIHGLLKRTDEMQFPEKLELKYFPCRRDGMYLTVNSYGLYYYTLDSTLLHETGARLTGEREDTAWVVVAYAETDGFYDFNFHHVQSSRDIIVDDDYADYPEANTSSPIAAGYAVKESGNILIGNGIYTSYLPVKITSNYVQVSGQEKENVSLRNVYSLSFNPVIYFNGNGGSIRNLSLSCGTTNYYAMEIYGSDLTLENLLITPMPGKTLVSGGIKGGGDNMYMNELHFDRTMWGIEVASNGGLIENCEFLIQNRAIQLTGENTIVRNNDITNNLSGMAIVVKSVYAGTGNQIVENNLITLTDATGVGSPGIIYIERYGGPENTSDSYIRNNTIVSASINHGVSAGIGNPPSKIVIEGNRYSCTNSRGGSAISLTGLRNDGASDIIVRNNIFDGLRSRDVITLYNTDLLAEGHLFAIYNNSFRMKETAEEDLSHNFITVNSFNYNIVDTTGIELVNNIFQGNGYSYFMKCQNDFSVLADYNIVHNFSSYINGPGSIIGLSHNIEDDPLFTDGELHVDPLSPALNKGTGPELFEYLPNVDINGISRPQGSEYDIGAYEKEE